MLIPLCIFLFLLFSSFFIINATFNFSFLDNLELLFANLLIFLLSESSESFESESDSDPLYTPCLWSSILEYFSISSADILDNISVFILIPWALTFSIFLFIFFNLSCNSLSIEVFPLLFKKKIWPFGLLPEWPDFLFGCWLYIILGCWLYIILGCCWLYIILGCCWLYIILGCCWLYVILLEEEISEKSFPL